MSHPQTTWAAAKQLNVLVPKGDGTTPQGNHHTQSTSSQVAMETDRLPRQSTGLLDLLTRTKNPKYVESENGNSVVLRIFELEGTSDLLELALLIFTNEVTEAQI